MKKQISQGGSAASEANFLLGFSYHDDQEDGQYYNSYGTKKGGQRKTGRSKQYHRPMKDYSVQSAFKFIMRDHARPTDDNEYYYALNLYDPNENVEWKDV